LTLCLRDLASHFKTEPTKTVALCFGYPKTHVSSYVLYLSHREEIMQCIHSQTPCLSANFSQFQPISAFRTSESESADFSQVRVRKFRTLKTLRTRTQRVCLFTHLYCKKVNISQKKSEISIFSFLKSYYSLFKPHAQISTIVKTSYVFH
jgi:hypothetical protein